MFWKRRSDAIDNPGTDVAKIEISADRCVHSSVVAAACRVCADECPQHALVANDDMLGLDETACTGCGLCVAACPQGAISIDDNTPVTGSEVLLICEKAGGGYGDLRTPCIHQFGFEQLAGLYNRGVREVVMATGNCKDCQKPQRDLFWYLERFNCLAASRGMAAMEVRPALEKPDSKWNRLRAGKEQIDPAKRRLFASLAGALQSQEDRGKPEAKPQLAGFQAKRAALDGAVFVAVPEIDSTKCDGCDACVRVCPQSALTLIKDEEGQATYAVTPQECTGCELCSGICPTGALELRSLSVCNQRSVVLRSFYCRSCGVSCHEPTKPGAQGDLCRICSQTQHNQKLFQVLS